MATLEIRNLTRRTAPAFAFKKALNSILPDWNVSLVLVGPKQAQALNKKLRRKSYVPNVLSYQTGPRSGEVILCPAIAVKEAPSYELSAPTYELFLFIHALMHLKGMRHGSTMEKAERTHLARLAPNYPNEKTHRNRHRHRDSSSQGRRH